MTEPTDGDFSLFQMGYTAHTGAADVSAPSAEDVQAEYDSGE